MIDTGVSFSEMEANAKPPLYDDGTYEAVVDKIEDGTGKENRPIWYVKLRIINHPELEGRQPLSVYTQLPWRNPADANKIDMSNTFTFVDFINGTKSQQLFPNGMVVNTDGTLTIQKEQLFGASAAIKVGHQMMKKRNPDDEDQIVNTVKFIYNKKGGGSVA